MRNYQFEVCMFDSILPHLFSGLAQVTIASIGLNVGIYPGLTQLIINFSNFYFGVCSGLGVNKTLFAD